MTLDAIADYPFEPGHITELSLHLRARARSFGLGGHLRRRQGQSLSFREFAPFAAGDDPRHIDWVASARGGGSQMLLRRVFEAEEQTRLVISVDDRAEMRWPSDPAADLADPAWPRGPLKLLLALWVARALAGLAVTGRDQVVLHRLFGGGRPQLTRGRDIEAAVVAWTRRLVGSAPPAPRLELGPLDQALRPGGGALAVWVILSDLLFDDPQHRLARRIARARRDFGWVVVVRLDSWPAEAALLQERAWRLQEMGATGEPGPPVKLDTAQTATVAVRMAAHVRDLLGPAGLPEADALHWSLDGAALAAPGEAARRLVETAPVIRRLFMGPVNG